MDRFQLYIRLGVLELTIILSLETKKYINEF